jgi:hypothetical protein
MTRVDRPTIFVDEIGSITVDVEPALGAAVTRRAQGLESPEAKRIPVASMRLDVVGDRRQRDDAAALAHGAERVLLELQGATSAPDVELVPLAPGSGWWSAEQARRRNLPGAPIFRRANPEDVSMPEN